MKIVLKNITIALSLFVLLISYQNCGKTTNSMGFSSTSSMGGTTDGKGDGGNIVITDPGESTPPSDDTVVCGGLGEDEGSEAIYGIKGSIYTSSKENDPKSAVKYASQATPVKNSNDELITIYMNDINVPERRFNQGFYNLSGDAVKDNKGNVLIEYFGLKLEFTLKLPQDMQPGHYQIALESDDGGVLKTLSSDNSYKTIIDNDGQHATQMKCTSKAVYFDHTTQIPSELYYYQGPREHIALRLAWKKVSSATSESSCSNLGNADGDANAGQWSIIPAKAYQRPGVTQSPNPCASK